MKKTITLIFLAGMISFGSRAQTVPGISLNGIREDTAQMMIAAFAAHRANDKTPTRESIWFNKATIHYIVKLLLAEKKALLLQNPARTDVPDGIRIYYACDPAITTAPLSNSVILVSTTYDGANSAAPSKANHKDYFEHSMTDSLFTSGIDIKGDVRVKKFIRKGDRLYSTCWFCSTSLSCDTTDTHYLVRKAAERLVHQFGDDPIITNSVWFNLGLFQAFDDDSRVDGMRVYFSRHPVSDDNETSGRQAFVLIPTEYSSFYKTHKDYFDCKITRNFLDKYLQRVKVSDSRTPFIGGGQDNGEICPINCNQ